MSTKTKSVVEPHDDDDGAYSVDQFCKQYSIGKTAFYAEVKAKRLSVKKHGSRTLVPRTVARAWFEALPAMRGRAPKSHQEAAA